VDFREEKGPTLLHGGMEWAAEGSLWIDPTTGDVLRSVIMGGNALGTATNMVTANDKQDRALGFRVPVDRQERPGSGKRWVDGTCTYSNFRAFEKGATLK
jgi:hypothetical protein